MRKQLSATEAKRITKPGRYAVGDGAYLQIVKPPGTARSWVFRYRFKGKPHCLGLGSCSIYTIDEAREGARKLRRLMHEEHKDPLTERRTAAAERAIADASAMSFKQCTEAYVNDKKVGWKSKVHAQQFINTMEAHCYPVFGDLPVASISTGLVLKALRPIWTTRSATAIRVRGRIETVLNWAKASNLRHGENPARWKGHLEFKLAKASDIAAAQGRPLVRHLESMPYLKVSRFMASLRAQEGLDARALEFIILTAARVGEAVSTYGKSGADWNQINDGIWTVPISSMKESKEHRIPLCDRALEILESLHSREGQLFPGVTDQRLRVLAKAVANDSKITVHGFRATLRTWGREKGYSDSLCEMILSHADSNTVQASYLRTDSLELRRPVMVDWAAYCGVVQ